MSIGAQLFYVCLLFRNTLSDIELTPEEQRQALWIAATATERNKKLFRDFFRHFAFLAVYFAILFMQRDVDASYQLNQGIISSLITQPIDYSVQPFAKTWKDIGQWVQNSITYLII